ncbi:MAG: hypothetical protein J0M15_15045 [Deltaproteobacteria bacterium]|jgi:hypothetical protein|nr:hypothetical protein [Deltaproteobacteria bacterium]
MKIETTSLKSKGFALWFWSSLFFFMTVSISLAEDFRGIVSLLKSSNWIAGLNIPLRVSGIDFSAKPSVFAEVVPGTLSSRDCKVLRDPFIPENFLLRCLKEGSVSLRFTVSSASGSGMILNYGPLNIVKLDGLKTPDSSSGGGSDNPGGGGGGNPDVLAGGQLFTTYCISCHTNKSSFLSRYPSSSTAIDAAINSPVQGVAIPAMTYLASSLTKSQIDQISSYLQAP